MAVLRRRTFWKPAQLQPRLTVAITLTTEIEYYLQEHKRMLPRWSVSNFHHAPGRASCVLESSDRTRSSSSLASALRPILTNQYPLSHRPGSGTCIGGPNCDVLQSAHTRPRHIDYRRRDQGLHQELRAVQCTAPRESTNTTTLSGHAAHDSPRRPRSEWAPTHGRAWSTRSSACTACRHSASSTPRSSPTRSPATRAPS